MAPCAPAYRDHFHRAVSQRHHDDHGLGLALRNQVVEDDVGAADSRPSAGVVAVAVQQIQDWVGRLRRRIVSRRGVDVIIPLVIGHCRLIAMMMDLTVRHVV